MERGFRGEVNKVYSAGDDGFGPLKLAHVEMMVKTLLRQQFLMRSPFDDAVIVDDQHQIGFANGTQPVRDDERRTAFE